jgi:hypothetical protein
MAWRVEAGPCRLSRREWWQIEGVLRIGSGTINSGLVCLEARETLSEDVRTLVCSAASI